MSCSACEMDNTFFLRVVLLGSRCGKTHIIQRYVHQRFSSLTRPTIGLDFGIKQLQLPSQQAARIQILDVASAERYSNMSRIYLRGLMGVFIAFDCTQPKSLESAIEWRQAASRLLPAHVPVILLMTKCDLQRHPAIPAGRVMADFCARHGFSAFYETSARDAEHQVAMQTPSFTRAINAKMHPFVAIMPDYFVGY
jgi:Ras-related protein Rab-32